MRIKQKPEDFAVTESWRFEETPRGEWRVYAMDKQKLSTFDAIGRIADIHNLPRSAFSFCGLKDKQGRTRQLIAVRGSDVDLQDEDLRLKYLGRTGAPLSAENTTSNRFGVTVRDLLDEEIARLPAAIAEVQRLGVVNYFDSQRFGSLKHGQGFIAKDLMRGAFEAALRNYLAKPSELDRSYDAKVKAFWRDHWGDWRKRCTIPGAEKYERILAVLRRDPTGFRDAFLRIDPKYRALLVFTYQSYLWNESARRLLMRFLPRGALLALKYQAGTLLFPRDAPPDVLRRLRGMSVPLLAPDSQIEDPDVRQAVQWVLGREKLALADLQVPETPEIFFRHEERPLLVYPGKLMAGKTHPDELNRGSKKVYIAFTLPPGSYATLVIRRLFSFSPERDEYPAPEPELAAEPGSLEAQGALAAAGAEAQEAPAAAEPAARRGRGEGRAAGRESPGGRPAAVASAERARASAPRRRPEQASSESAGAGKRPGRRVAPTAPEAPPASRSDEQAPAESSEPLGFRARRRLEKERRAEARAAARAKRR